MLRAGDQAGRPRLAAAGAAARWAEAPRRLVRPPAQTGEHSSAGAGAGRGSVVNSLTCRLG